MQNANQLLDFTEIRRMLAERAATTAAKERLEQLEPTLAERELSARLAQTTQARILLETLGEPPLSTMTEMEKMLPLLSAGALLSPAELIAVTQFLAACRRMKLYLNRGRYLQTELAYQADALYDLPELTAEIERCIRGESVDTNASKALSNLRSQIDGARGQIKGRLASLLQKNKKWFADGFVVTRGDRLALPVRREYKNQVPGTVLDISASGSTYFIEPSAVRKAQEELQGLLFEEENEVRRILYTLTAMAQDALHDIEQNKKALEALDFAFAKGKLSTDMRGVCPQMVMERTLRLEDARHPLFAPEACVPLNISMEEETRRGILITGPNTGGKTATLKTVGLLCLMGQSGLHVPAREATLPLCSAVLCDMGDGQSLSENLSTFSAHMVHMLEILRRVNGQSLVLLDELGSGTDPMEGMGIAIAILEELRKVGCLLMVTTHYPAVKEYAAHAQGFVNARMAFDKESLRPLYQLEIGEAGESCALYILKRLGFPEDLLRRAQREAYRSQPGLTAAPDESLFVGAETSLRRAASPRLQEATTLKQQSSHALSFTLGDSVFVQPGNEIGLVYAPADEKGEIGVQVRGEKRRVPHKRVKLHVPASELYPPDYDFSIVFDTVENRKARHQLDKGHRPEFMVRYEEAP